jgi:hypothetical protein
VQVQLGPIAKDQAVIWLEYADDALADLRGMREPTIHPSALDAFADMLREWNGAVLDDRAEWVWIGEDTAEHVEFLMAALYQAGLAMERASRLGKATLRPPEADEFHMMLVGEVLTVLKAEGPSHGQFVESLRAEWEVARRT